MADLQEGPDPSGADDTDAPRVPAAVRPPQFEARWWGRPTPWLWLLALIVLVGVAGQLLHVVGATPVNRAETKSSPAAQATVGNAGIAARCVLDRICIHANLQGQVIGPMDLRGADFDRTSAAGALFDETSLNGASFRDANLSGATFLGVDLRGAIFVGACLRGVVFKDVKLAGAEFLQADLTGVYVPRTELRGTIGWHSTGARNSCPNG